MVRHQPVVRGPTRSSGRALLRYDFHAQVSYAGRFFFAIDATMFTDRRTHAVAPSELDLTPELGVNIIDGLAAHLAFERDMPVDRGGTVQHFLMLFATWDFRLIDSHRDEK